MLGRDTVQRVRARIKLRCRLAVARTVDAATVALFRDQVEHARRVDRQFGGVTTLDQLRAQIDQVQRVLMDGAGRGHRPALAAVLTEASTLAGWQALDRAATAQAWDHHERAKLAAREAESSVLLAHATAQQAMILIDIGETGLAVEQLIEARRLAKGTAPALLRAWLAASHGEGLAAAGRHSDALRTFDEADALLPDEPSDPALPFLFLAGAHLDRWRGNALARLGEPEAIVQLTGAVARLPASFVRARAMAFVDLAYAHSAAGDRDAALTYARQARQLANQIKSDRQQRRLRRLVLPT